MKFVNGLKMVGNVALLLFCLGFGLNSVSRLLLPPWASGETFGYDLSKLVVILLCYFGARGSWHRIVAKTATTKIITAVAVVLLGLFSMPAFAQEYGTYPKGAVLSVTSFPPGATVSVDGRPMLDRDGDGAVTPLHFDLSLGKHTITVAIGDTGWQSYSSTITVTKKDNDLSVTLLPVLTTGLQGQQGPVGPVGPASTVPGPPGLSIIGPPGIPGVAGQSIVGPAGPAGASVVGPAGKDGAAGISALAGIWSPTGIYSTGQSIMRDPSVSGSRGPFFNLTGINAGIDPVSDSTNWVYCCGTPVLGYAPLLMTGSAIGTYQPGSSTNVMSHTFSVNEIRTLTTMIISLQFAPSTPTTAWISCFDVGGTNLSPSALGYTGPNPTVPNCVLPPVCKYGIMCQQPSLGSNSVICGAATEFHQPYFLVMPCPYTVPGQPVGTMNWSILKNGVTVLTMGFGVSDVGHDCTVSVPNGGSISFVAGDTLSVSANNPSTSVDGVISGTWMIQ
jgi:PEGA domain-containing protein